MKEKTKSISTSENKLLYHYTGINGFKGIIQNKGLRMTDSNFVNDPNDCRLFAKFVEKYMQQDNEKDKVLCDVLDIYEKNLLEKRNKNKYPLYRDEIVKLFKKGCSVTDYINYLYDNIPIYVISFTSLNDAMNMWNYYGKDGMQLAFSNESLVNSFKTQLSSDREFLTVAPVIYIDNDLKAQNISKINDFALWTNNIYNVRKNTDTSCFVHSVTTYPCFFIVFRTLVLVHIL